MAPTCWPRPWGAQARGSWPPCPASAVGQGAMWACASAGLFRIDPATEEVVDQIPIRFNLGIGGCYVIASPGAAWVATQPGVIVRVDTGSDRGGQSRKVASSILAMTYGFHALWV